MPCSLSSLVFSRNTYRSSYTVWVRNSDYLSPFTQKCECPYQCQIPVVMQIRFSLHTGHSRWSGYLQSLPSIDLPVFWGCDSLARPSRITPILEPYLDDPLMWLRGTEVMKRLEEKDDAGRTLRVSRRFWECPNIVIDPMS